MEQADCGTRDSLWSMARNVGKTSPRNQNKGIFHSKKFYSPFSPSTSSYLKIKGRDIYFASTSSVAQLCFYMVKSLWRGSAVPHCLEINTQQKCKTKRLHTANTLSASHLSVKAYCTAKSVLEKSLSCSQVQKNNAHTTPLYFYKYRHRYSQRENLESISIAKKSQTFKT